MTLKDVAKKVIDNRELKTVLTNYIMYESLNPKNDQALLPYENLVRFQVQECDGEIEKAGYQVGEPWAGNIKRAPILFVSRRLAYVSNEICLRYIPNDSPDGYEIACTDKIFQNGRLIDGDTTLNEVITWCNRRLGNAALKGNSLYIRTREDDGTESIAPNSYWCSVRNNFEFLLPKGLKQSLRKQFASTMVGYVQEIMKYVACTSVVPYKVVPPKSSRYKKDFIQGKTFDHCWKNVAEEIISLSGAKVIVLVGDEILNAFENSAMFASKSLKATENSTANKKGKRDTIKLYEWDKRLVVNVAPNQGGMRNFSRYFQAGSGIIATLRAKVKSLV